MSEKQEDNQQEEEQDEPSFSHKLSQNMNQIGQAIQMPEIYLVISFFALNGLFSPSFGQFSYFFMLNVAHITKF